MTLLDFFLLSILFFCRLLFRFSFNYECTYSENGNSMSKPNGLHPVNVTTTNNKLNTHREREIEWDDEKEANIHDIMEKNWFDGKNFTRFHKSCKFSFLLSSVDLFALFDRLCARIWCARVLVGLWLWLGCLLKIYREKEWKKSTC